MLIAEKKIFVFDIADLTYLLGEIKRLQMQPTMRREVLAPNK